MTSRPAHYKPSAYHSQVHIITNLNTIVTPRVT